MARPGDGGSPSVPFDPDIEIEPVRESGPSTPPRRGRQVQMAIVAALALGGLLGAVSRYAISLALPTGTGQFPWATFLVNVSGSLALGFLLVLVVEQFPRGRLARPVLGSGFLGAFTTFSTFMVGALVLIRDGHPATAVAYLAASVAGGLVAAWVGMSSARLVLRTERWLQDEAA